MNRSRSYSWPDPQGLAAQAQKVSGYDFLQAIVDGDLPAPPFAETTGIYATEIEKGRAVFTMRPEEWHYNPIGTVHGGVLAALADSALGCAVHSALPEGSGYTSLDLTIKFTRAATVDSGLLTCEARVVTIGRRAASAEATITDTAGRVVAHAICSCMIFGG